MGRAVVVALVLVVAGCSDSDSGDDDAAASTTTAAPAATEAERFVDAVIAATGPDDVQVFGPEVLRCILTAQVDAIGWTRLADAGIDPTEYAGSLNAAELGLTVDPTAAAELQAQVLGCWPDPVSDLVAVVQATPGAIAAGHEGTFESCLREAVTAEQVAADFVADFVEPVRDDRATDDAFFRCTGTTDT